MKKKVMVKVDKLEIGYFKNVQDCRFFLGHCAVAPPPPSLSLTPCLHAAHTHTIAAGACTVAEKFLFMSV